MFYLFFYQKIVEIDGDNRQFQLANDCPAPNSVS